MVKIEVYEKGITYHSAISFEVDEMDMRDLERIFIKCGNTYRVTPIENESGVKKDDF